MIYCFHCEIASSVANNPKLRSRLRGKGQGRYRAGAKCGCQKKSVLSSKIEDQFLEIVRKLEVKREYIEVLSRLALQSQQITVEDGATFDQNKIAQISMAQRKLDAAVNLYSDGTIERHEYLKLTQHLHREIDLLRAQTSEKEKVDIKVANVVETIQTLISLWEKGDSTDKQGYARILFDYVVYDLDKENFTGVKLSAWASHYLQWRVMLGEDGKGTNLTLARLSPNIFLLSEQLIFSNN